MGGPSVLGKSRQVRPNPGYSTFDASMAPSFVRFILFPSYADARSRQADGPQYIRRDGYNKWRA